MTEISPPLEAVYYGAPIPLSKATLTVLGIVFDRLHFPNVHLPTDGFDIAAVMKEAERIESVGFTDYNTKLLIGALRTLSHMEDLKKFCHFSGTEAQVFGGQKDTETAQLAVALEELIFGPPREGFTPIFETGFNKGLPGSDLSIDYPGPLLYPATAMVYAAKHGLTLINDNPALPVPGLGGESAKNNEKVLSIILALECVQLVLPTIPPLTPREIVDLRDELQPSLRLFRAALLRLAASLNRDITKDSTHDDILQAAQFLVRTEVQPSLVELQEALKRPAKRWLTRAYEVAKQVPELVSAFATMPPHLALAKAMVAIGGLLVDMQEVADKKMAARSPMYYLLKLRTAAQKE